MRNLTADEARMLAFASSITQCQPLNRSDEPTAHRLLAMGMLGTTTTSRYVILRCTARGLRALAIYRAVMASEGLVAS